MVGDEDAFAAVLLIFGPPPPMHPQYARENWADKNSKLLIDYIMNVAQWRDEQGPTENFTEAMKFTSEFLNWCHNAGARFGIGEPVIDHGLRLELMLRNSFKQIKKGKQ